MPEVENAVLDVLDYRGVGPGGTIPFIEIEVSMDARGYPLKWVRRAVTSLIGKGVLRSAGFSAVQRLRTPPSSADVRRRRPRPSRTRRATLARL